jgi:hypothetical protein
VAGAKSKTPSAYRLNKKEKVMAGFENDEFEALRGLLLATSKEAVPAGEDAAARVYLQAARAAAPIETTGNPFGKYRNATSKHPGQLKGSIKIIRTRNRSTLSTEIGGNTIMRIFVGPEKKKGYYGFFVEKGHKTAGPHRIARKSSGSTHSQSGVTSRGNIAPHPWFEPAIRSAESSAMNAFESAFNSKLDELNRKE